MRQHCLPARKTLSNQSAEQVKGATGIRLLAIERGRLCIAEEIGSRGKATGDAPHVGDCTADMPRCGSMRRNSVRPPNAPSNKVGGALCRRGRRYERRECVAPAGHARCAGTPRYRCKQYGGTNNQRTRPTRQNTPVSRHEEPGACRPSNRPAKGTPHDNVAIRALHAAAARATQRARSTGAAVRTARHCIANHSPNANRANHGHGQTLPRLRGPADRL